MSVSEIKEPFNYSTSKLSEKTVGWEKRKRFPPNTKKVNKLENLYLHSLQRLQVSVWFAVIGFILMVATYIASKLGDHKTLERIYKACSWFIIATIALLPIAIIGLIIFFVYVAAFCK